MKINIKRETTIGLSVLLVLTLILGTVAARRFIRSRHAMEEALANAEEKTIDGPSGEHREHGLDGFPKPSALTPLEMPHREKVQPLDDPGHWNNPTIERRKDTPAVSPASSLIAVDPPATLNSPMITKSEKRKDERENKHEGMHDTEPAIKRAEEMATIHKAPELPSADVDDRYSGVIAPSPEHEKRGESKPMVIQVSDGERADGMPRPIDRETPNRRRTEPYQAIQPGPDRGFNPIPRAPDVDRPPARSDGLAADNSIDREAARLRENTKEREYRPNPPDIDKPVVRSGNDAPYPPRAGNGLPSNAAAPMGDAPNYAAAPSGYAPENAFRREIETPGRVRAQMRLRDDGQYEVQPNDSYWTISEKVYGSGAYFRALAEQNRGKAARPDRLPPGLIIATPPIAQLEKEYPDLCPRPNRREAVHNRASNTMLTATTAAGRTYVVQEGDTLSSIARNELGKVSRWAEIYQLNREALGKDYDYLTPGMRLVLPFGESQSGDRTTRRSDGDVPLLR